MSTQGKRLETILKLENVSQEKFGEAIGVSKSAVNKVITDKGNFELQKYITLSEVFDVSLDWLILGKGSMLITEKPAEDELKRDFDNLIARLSKVEQKVFQNEEDTQS